MSNYNNHYIYETSPRKVKPEYAPTKKNNNLKTKTQKSTVSKQKTKNNVKQKTKTNKIRSKYILGMAIAFVIVFAMGYQNSKINEQFSIMKSSEKQLASIQKENEQLKVNIENSLNYSDIEQKAKEKLGMQKATTKQTKYVSLPKRDYVEVASEQIVMNSDTNWLKSIIDNIMNIVR